MATKKTVTTVVEVWDEGEWGGPMNLDNLENFVREAREAGFTNDDRITVQNGVILNSIKLRRVDTE